GKSAQFPLHTWLPDAMEGPTPVSALLHSATMVAAGVFLFARFHPVFMAAPTTLEVVIVIAAFTAVLSSTMAMVSMDMKRVLAFSSISQLGYMLMGLAAGGLFAGFFHLTTHAIFKALLFLCAGAYIHHHGTNDMVAMGRDGARKMPVVTLGLILGGGALAGIPPLAGFWSKEAILLQVGTAGSLAGQIGGYLAAFLTAYYTFRMIFLITRPNPDGQLAPEEPAGAQFDDAHGHDDHGHGAPWSMRIPILVLSLGAVGLGFVGDGLGELLGLEVPQATIAEMAPAIGIALLGVAMAWFDFGRAGAPQTGFISKVPALQSLFANRWHVDTVYNATFVRAAQGIASVCFTSETKGLDEAADRVADGTMATGALTARAQTGRIQIYVGSAVVVASLLSFYLMVG
ncbi:MAG: proton-conducting transporter membrane subunit, partial [Myxococcota bacterium]|nr:proton-conducting transporter membrane subunit [Myxococcota bacterium]